MRIFLVLITMVGLVMACGPGEGTERAKSYSSGTEVSGGDNDSDESGNASDDTDETTPVLSPTEIAGSFLTCTPVSQEEEFAGQYGCGLRDDASKKLDSDLIRDGLILFTVDGAGEEAAIEDVDRSTDDTPWHVRFTSQADPETIASIKAKITIDGDEYEFIDETWDQDDPNIEDELQSYRDELSQAVQDAEDKADVL